MFIYVIAPDENGPVKVGISANPYSRLSALQIGSAAELKVFAAFAVPSKEIALWFEGCFHDTQRQRRIRGEWFDLSAPDAAIVIQLHVRWSLERSGLTPEEIERAMARVRGGGP